MPPTTHLRGLLLGAVLVLPIGIGSGAEPSAAPLKSPLAPRAAAATLKVAPGLRLELVAAEPQIESPVAMAFDEDGRLWVVEMLDYPNGPAKGQPPAGRIKVLEDRDGDGFFETSTIFADKLLFANGLMPWQGGVVVTAAPHILYLKDSKGTGRAERRDILYEGFTEGNPQLRVNHPILGLDGWIYVANGLRGGQVRRAGNPAAKPVNLSGMDFRFDLVHDRHEAISGMGQYGNSFDDWGQRFVCDNRHHLRHVVVESRYIRRNPFLAVPEVVEDTAEHGQQVAGAGAKIYPLSKNWTTSNLHAGRFTAACSVYVYRGDLLPDQRGHVFTCDPTGNLVHEEILTPRGATFRAKPPKDGVEFLASPDDWFRPVFLGDGPDGALYVVDMYRAVIEHPEFMPTELKNRPDLTLGKERGRIWRIVPEKYQGKPARPRLSKAGSAELVKLLEHPNAWWRTTAQRLLWSRQDKAAVPGLRQLCQESKSAPARLHAAWLLKGLDALSDELLLKLLHDEQAQVRAQAVLLAESRLKSEAVRTQLIQLAGDPDDQVRFQVALSLGEWDDDAVIPPLKRIALAGAADRWTRIAVASAVPRRAGALLTELLRGDDGLATRAGPGRLDLLQELAALVGARRDVAEAGAFLTALTGLPSDARTLPAQMAGLSGLADGMGRRGTQLGAFLQALPAEQKPVRERTERLLRKAAQAADDAKRPLPERLTAIRLLAHSPWELAQPPLLKLLNEAAEQEIRLAAVNALAASPRKEVSAALMKAWRGYTPAIRREVAEAMLRGPERVQFFLDELAEGRVKPGDLDATRMRQLVNHPRPELRDRARKLLQANLPPERKQVLEQYRPALAAKGEASRGQEIFRKNCATCHRVAGVGIDVGPDISDTRTKTVEMLLIDILNPNQAIDNNYVNYVVSTKSGKTVSGVIAVETASSITLKRAENQTDVILRQDIEEIQSTGVSLMPEGLEKEIPVAAMADLLAFLKNWRYLEGAVPAGEKPKP